jgi:hypothetical protein
MDRFVARENIKCFVARLKSDMNPHTRSHLQRILIREEDRLGVDREFIAELEQTIISFDALIETQEKIVATLERNGDEAARQRATLKGLRDAHVLCQIYCRKLLTASGKTEHFAEAKPGSHA